MSDTNEPDVRLAAEKVAAASAALSTEGVVDRTRERGREADLVKFAGMLDTTKVAPGGVDLLFDALSDYGYDFVEGVVENMRARAERESTAS